MGRNAKFEREDFLRIAAGEAANGRLPTVQALAAAARAPVGSIYHRFDSREQLLAEAWLLAVRTFQLDFLPLLAGARTADQGVKAALAVPQWSRAHPQLAGMLTLCRQGDFVGEGTPDALRREAASLNNTLAKHLRAFADRTGRSLDRCKVAVIGMPYGAVRLFLPNPAPVEIDAMVAASYQAIMRPA
jgi:AcrR family transcriptional regulator